MRKFYLFCGLMLGVSFVSAQSYPQNNYPQNNYPQNNYPQNTQRQNYPTYDERNYANNQWSETIAAGTQVKVYAA